MAVDPDARGVKRTMPDTQYNVFSFLCYFYDSSLTLQHIFKFLPLRCGRYNNLKSVQRLQKIDTLIIAVFQQLPGEMDKLNCQ